LTGNAVLYMLLIGMAVGIAKQRLSGLFQPFLLSLDYILLADDMAKFVFGPHTLDLECSD